MLNYYIMSLHVSAVMWRSQQNGLRWTKHEYVRIYVLYHPTLQIRILHSSFSLENCLSTNVMLPSNSSLTHSSTKLIFSYISIVVIPDSTTMVQLTQTSIQTQFEEFTTNQHVNTTESQISTELYNFSSLGESFISSL